MANELRQHYEGKYAEEASERTRLVEHPDGRKQAVARLVPGGARLLEVGAGSGDVLLAVADKYAEAVALEYTHVRAELLRHVFAGRNVTILEGAIEETPLEPAFDTIIMNDVVEHLVEPLSVLRGVRELLTPSGVLILHTPNVAKLSRRIRLLAGEFPSTTTSQGGLLDWKGKPVTSLDDGHLHYFTWLSMTRLLKEWAGFSDVEWHGYMGRGRLGHHLFERSPAFAHELGRRKPTLFSEICVIAHR